jgi:hypothetical protein
MDHDDFEFAKQCAVAVLPNIVGSRINASTEGLVNEAWEIAEAMVAKKRSLEHAQHAVVRAIYCKEVEVKDPDTKAPVHLSVYKDPSTGGMLAIDSSFIEQVEAVIPNPLQPSVTLVLDDED